MAGFRDLFALLLRWWSSGAAVTAVSDVELFASHDRDAELYARHDDDVELFASTD